MTVAPRHRITHGKAARGVEHPVRFLEAPLDVTRDDPRAIADVPRAMEPWHALAKWEAKAGPKPETFDFLGFTHLCRRSRRGKFTIHVRTMRTRLRRSLKRVSAWCQRHRHDPLAEQQTTLNAILRGHYQYYGRPTNSQGIGRFYRLVRRIWQKWLNGRTRGRSLPWPVYQKLLDVYPRQRPYIAQPWAGAVSRA